MDKYKKEVKIMKFDEDKTKYIFNIGRGTLHYYNCKSCYNSKSFNPNDKNLKFYRTEDEVYKENTTHFKKCKNCFKNM